MNILHITSSSRGSASYSNRVAGEVLDELTRRNPGAAVTLRDLARDPLPHIDDDFVAATSRRTGRRPSASARCSRSPTRWSTSCSPPTSS